MNELFKWNDRGERCFQYGNQAWMEARKAAEECCSFEFDVEEEIFTDEGERSCYNCLYRRWTKDSFTCFGILNEKNPL